MKRLREDVSVADPLIKTAARLIRHVPPIVDDALRQRRVRLQLRSPQPGPAMTFRLRRPAMVVAILMASAAGASAMVDGGWRGIQQRALSWTHVRAAIPARATPVVQATKTLRPTAPAALPEQSHLVTPVAVPTVVAEEPLAVAVSPPARRHHRSDSKRRVAQAESRRAVATSVPPIVPRVPAAPSLVPSGPGAELVVAAMQARRSGDLAGAERLLTAYRDRYPDGALNEEALVLSLEAAALRGSSRGPELARQYLAQFPGGQYREWVHQLLRTSPP